MPTNWIILDAASAPLANAGDYIDKSAIDAPSNYAKPEAISGYIEKEYARRVAAAGLDLDLARLTAIGMLTNTGDPTVMLCHTEDDERAALTNLKALLGPYPHTQVIGYGIFNFDLQLLMRRARYLGVTFPKLSTDRYKSPNVDLLLELSDRDPQRRRSLNFYCTRLGWTDCVKPLSGEEEARVHDTGAWDKLRDSVARDVEVTKRLASWWGAI